MLTENAQAWVATLRSGAYKQGQGALHNLDRDEYCCLGVACDMFDKANPGVISQTSFVRSGPMEVFAGQTGVLPSVVQKWLGLSGREGSFNFDGKFSSLTEQNDTGSTFEEIADLIESEPEDLFVA